MTEEQPTRESDSSEEEDSQRHEGHDESEDGQQAEQRSGEDEEQDDEEEDDEDEDEEESEDSDDSSDKWAKFAGSLPVVLGGVFCVAFFVWVCLQMAGQTVGGPPLLLGIFGASILGILAAVGGMAFNKLGGD